VRLRLRVSIDGNVDDVAVDIDDDATVGELAARLHDRQRGAGRPPGDPDELGLIIDIDGEPRRVLAPSSTIGECGLRSGGTVAPTRPGLTEPRRSGAATLHVHDGPDAPSTFSLPFGVTTVGRGAAADIVLTDPFVSKRHARIRVADAVEIVDDSSANGIGIGDRVVDRLVVGSGDRVTLGDTTVSVVAHDVEAAGGSTNEVAFNRSPRVAPRYAGVELTAPEPPQPPSGQRFPIVSLVVPVAMAGVIFAVTRSTFAIVFVAISPMMLIGSWLETTRANKKQLAAGTARFRLALADLELRLDYARGLEQRSRRAEHPSAVDLLEAVESRSALLWTRRPEHDTFGQVRLGLGTQRSRNDVRMPSTNNTHPHLWRELLDVVERFRFVDDVPVVGDLAAAGNLGVAGPARVAAPVLRGLVAQYVGLHSPAELTMMAIGVSEEWGWMKWLPHVRTGGLAGNAAEATAVVAELEALIDGRVATSRSDHEASALPRTLLVVDDVAAHERSRLVQIAERGPMLGVHVVWFAPSLQRLPAACRAFVEVDGDTGRGSVGVVPEEQLIDLVAPAPVGAAAIERFARRLSPVVDAGAALDHESDLPRSVTLADLAGHDAATDAGAIVDLWCESRPSRRGDHGLRALVGQTADGPLHLDLRTQGPHALVGGTTGSGKSEFLQSWILSMAMTSSPSRVTFLLVDYKGGAAFADCVELPHCVGVVTDLGPHLVRRALTSLDAELRHREQLLHGKRAKDLLELEHRDDPDCPPSLVIVVDEFAALVADVPEFVDGVVDIAQRGRSLGLHLVLATQRPAGVIRDNLRANTNLRIALRMADRDDSIDVIGTDQAALLDSSIPGRAIVKAGPGSVVPFQAAYAGGHSVGTARGPSIEIEGLRFGTGERWTAPGSEIDIDEEHRLTDIRRVVRTVTEAARRLDLAPPRRPWLPELTDRYGLEALRTERADRALVFGVADHPEAQVQTEVAFHPDADGNMAVLGTGGSGKSVFLRSLAVAAGFASTRSGPCWVYGLDFGTRGLQLLESLPHVGSVISGDDPERLRRLLRVLEETIGERAARYAGAKAATIHDYRECAGGVAEPRILLLVDGVGAFRSEYEGGADTRWWEVFRSIANDGRSVGVHVVVSADRPTAIPSGLASTIQRQLVLRLANDMDYALVDAPTGVAGRTTPPGRGFLDGREVQVAVIGGDGGLAGQAAEIDRLAAAMRRAEVVDAPPIRSLPDRVALSSLGPVERPVLGICDETLESVGFAPTGTFVVTGPPRSGTSTAVATMLRSLAAARPATEFVLFARRRSALASVVPWAATAHDELEIGELARRLVGRLDGFTDGPLVAVIEAIDELLDTDADLPLQRLVKACRDNDAFVIAEGETSGLSGSWPLLQAVKINRSGIVLQPDQLDGDAIFKTAFPRTTRAEFPAGRGLMVQGGRVRKVQVALPE
jgi:S-DNA-T family DNA segregation ATPase FtsK/SpoIIIE